MALLPTYKGGVNQVSTFKKVDVFFRGYAVAWLLIKATKG